MKHDATGGPAAEEPAWCDRFIARVPGVQGGEPVVRGTRTPVRTIAVLFHETYPGDMAEVQRALSHLTSEQINAALAFYELHRAEIDGYIAEHQYLLDQLKQAG
jgi:uncharacterized protein (DUF433 family)